MSWMPGVPVMRSSVRMAVLAVIAALQPSVFAGEAPDLAALRSKLAARFPDIPIVDVLPSPLPGMYEVFTGSSMVYVDPTGEFLLVGQLLETRTRVDLSSERVEARSTVDFNKLPLDRAIKIVKGDGSRKLAVFSDPDCPYCEQLEKELARVNNVTIYILLLPIESLHPEAPARAVRLWCAENPAAAWADWMLRRKEPAERKCDNDPVKDVYKAAIDIKVSSTPTLVFSSGRRYSGTLPARRIEQLLDAKEPAVAGTAATPAAAFR
jgi:thiol:disulfide interchange protein DsbC